jgi:hypothetical protein
MFIDLIVTTNMLRLSIYYDKWLLLIPPPKRLRQQGFDKIFPVEMELIY